MAFALIPIALTGTGCSRSVNALYRTPGPALDARAGDAAGRESAGADATVTGVLQTCPTPAGAPAGVPPLPSPAQVAYQRTELTAFMHFGLNTFDGTEYGDSTKDTPSLFNPTNLDANQWIAALEGAGFGQVMLVAKHSTGFCLWPSAYTDYSVKNSPWRNGQGDVVRDFTEAAHAAGLRVGFYLSPWDVHFPSSSPDYAAYFKNQLTELLTNYGPVHELELNGYNAPTNLDWQGIIQLAHALQPEMLVWAGPEIATTGTDLRWLGNQTGQATRATSSVGNVPNGGPVNVWYAAEAPVSDRVGSWFWHPNGTTISLADLQSVYFSSVGMNTTLNFNVPPATTGQFDMPDLALLQSFGAWQTSLYATNLLSGQPATADSTWSSPGFAVAKANDGDVCTYWAAAGGRTTARLEITPAAPITIKIISIREPIELGERVTAYHVELRQAGVWNRSPNGAAGTPIQGTVIGERQLWQLDATTADAVALVIDSAKDVPAIAEFSAY